MYCEGKFLYCSTQSSWCSNYFLRFFEVF